MKRKPNNTHFTYETRKLIEEKLNEGLNITNIADILNRNKSSVKREIDNHKTCNYPSTFNNNHPCLKHNTCLLKSFDCYLNCKNIEINTCPKLISSPHICNHCDSKKGCRYVKYYYKAFEANCEYQISWKEDRAKLHYTDNELDILNTDFYNLVISTRSIYHSLIVINNRGFNFKRSSIYRQIKSNQLKLRYEDLPRNRKQKKTLKDKNYKTIHVEGHTYEDYIEYREKHIKAIETQMDTVIGTINATDPVILTLEIVEINFIFIFKISSKTFNETISKLKFFQNNIGTEIFNNIFEILLTDNGSEFTNCDVIQKTFPNINIFYCHPYSSFEKGSIENNHEFIRRVIPKSVSLKPYTQKDYNLLASHINSLYREKLEGKCPFDLIEKYIPLDIIKQLGYKKIQDDKINLNPSLLGEKNIENIKKHLDYSEIKKSNIHLNTL